MNSKILRLVVLVLTGVLVLTACGDNDAETQPSGSFNDADVTFAHGMIPHHQQAVQMAEMAATRADSPQVKELAEEITAAQGPEIEQMTAWLEDWGQDVPSALGDGMGDGMGHDMGDGDTMADEDMPGMMTDTQMRDLASASGAAWDRMFLSLMIVHHEGALEMARTEQADGKNPDAIALAEDIEAAQEAEIATMRALLGS